MPPKVAAPTPAANAPPVEPPAFKLSLKISQPITEPQTSPGENKPGIRARIFSKSWTTCSVTTPIYGNKDNLPWELNEVTSTRSASISYTFDANFSELSQLKTFQEDSNIYIIFFWVSETSVTPVSFLSLDCSSFLFNKAPIYLKRTIHQDLLADIALEAEKTISKWSVLLPLQPLTLKVKSLNNFPLYAEETYPQACTTSYFYGCLRFGPNFIRNILLFPSQISQEHELLTKQKYPIDQTICILPGLEDISFFKQLLETTTYSLEIHQDNLYERVFTSTLIEEYCKKQATEPEGLGLLGVAAPVPAATGGKKGAPPPKNAEPVIPVFTPTPTAMNAADQCLLTAIHTTLYKGHELFNHGSAKFRLEQLLEKSNDLLTQFNRRRHGQHQGDDHIIVKEDLLVEVRLEKPTNPPKWDLPSDLSLRKALQLSKESKNTKKTNKNIPPRYELFLINGTNISLQAEYHRPLETNVRIVDSDLPLELQAFVTNSSNQGSGLSEEEVQHMLQETPFTRMMILFPYLDDETLRGLNEGLNEVNSRALPNIQGTVRSYSLTSEEKIQADKGHLDVLSGFMIIDDDIRLVVLEGLAKPGGAMETFYINHLLRFTENTPEKKILCNPEILFPTRLYTDFSPDIKRIRIRGKLQKLSKQPEIYNHLQIDMICFQAIDQLMILFRAENLKSSKSLDMYPSYESLNKLELLYGEAISRGDIDGTLKKEFIQTYDDRKGKLTESAATLLTATSNGMIKERSKSHSTTILGEDGEEGGEGNEEKQPRFIPTDCHNNEFEEKLRLRSTSKPKDFLEIQRQQRQQAWYNMLHRRQTRNDIVNETIKKVLGVQEIDESQPPKIYLYSNQSLNFKAKAWNSLRQNIKQDHSATYTFSPEFVSQTVCVVDDEEEKKYQQQHEKESWLTAKGFQYPKPKTRKELITHPKKPSEARIEELKEPFRDILDRKLNDSSTNESIDPIIKQRELHFTNQIKPMPLFGALETPKFEHDFTLSLVGNREQLPRGSMINESKIDSKFFRSVHLGGENQAKIVAEAMAQEKEEWKSKIVVDHLDFKVGGYNVRDKPLQIDRYHDILKDEPHTAALKMIREGPSNLAYTTTPLSILNVEPYVSNASTNALGRDSDKSKFITATQSSFKKEFSQQSQSQSQSQDTSMNENPEDFHRYFSKSVRDSKLVNMVAKRKHPSLDKSSSECLGPKWEPA